MTTAVDNFTKNDFKFTPSLEQFSTSGLSSSHDAVSLIFNCFMRATLKLDKIQLSLENFIRGSVKHSEDALKNMNTRANAFCVTSKEFAYDRSEWDRFKSGSNITVQVLNQKDLTSNNMGLISVHSLDELLKQGFIDQYQFSEIHSAYLSAFNQMPHAEAAYLREYITD